MYGLLLDCIQKLLCERYGEHYWAMIRRRANLKNQWFVTHEIYSDSVMRELVDAAAIELGEKQSTVMRMFGEYFAKNIGSYGYARLLRVLGRDLRDFLNGLDDLHEYLRFSYPKMSPPSFFCENETAGGLRLHYTTKRKGYLEYVIGQLITVGRIYGKDIEVEVLSEETSESGDTTHFVMELKFDNKELLRLRQPSMRDTDFTIDAHTFLGVFPFCLLLDKDLIVKRVGRKLQEVLPDLMEKRLNDCFTIRKPLFDTLNWRMIALHANSVFELVSIEPVSRKSISSRDTDYLTPPPKLRLKGEMKMLSDNDTLAFLCSPVMDSPEDLYESGIYVNDLSMHDSSRDIILAGSQKDPELNLAFNQEKIRSAQLEESIQQTDQLLFQMIPKPIADQLRNGETPLNTCKEFSSVSILFSDIVSFTPMCSRLHPMEVVCVLNAMYVAYDKLCEEHHVYKVETIGDAYMVLCGAPVYTIHHAEYITNFGLDIIKATYKINDPSTGQSLRIRIGIHSGNVVAGVVGSTVLRYDVFGDTVNVAARMEATGEPMKIHISKATADLLDDTLFTIEERGHVEVKGKGRMQTFWVSKNKELDQERPLTSNPCKALPTLAVTLQPPPTTSPSRKPHKSTSSSISRLCSPSSIKPPTSPNSSRPLSPKPDEWPQATSQLRKFNHLPFDYSIPSKDGLRNSRSRRNTAPPGAIQNLDIAGQIRSESLSPTPESPGYVFTTEGISPILVSPNHISTPNTDNTFSSQSSVHDHTLSDLSSTLLNQHQLECSLSQPFEQNHMSKSTQLIPNEEQPFLPHNGSSFSKHMQISEINLMHIRGSICDPYPNKNIEEIEQLVHQAEENAMQARNLADRLLNIYQMLKEEHGVTKLSTPLCNSTSVDPYVYKGSPIEPKKVEDTPTPIKNCPLGQAEKPYTMGQGDTPQNYCIIL